jgi:hypothetical protein
VVFEKVEVRLVRVCPCVENNVADEEAKATDTEPNALGMRHTDVCNGVLLSRFGSTHRLLGATPVDLKGRDFVGPFAGRITRLCGGSGSNEAETPNTDACN